MKKYLCVIIISLFALRATGSNLATPGASFPEARVAVGASYHLGGYTLTNSSIPSIWNRLHSRIEYAPLNLLNLGIELGATQIDVERYLTNSDTMPYFHGKFAFSGGISLKVATPQFLQQFRVTGISKASLFSSKNSFGAKYYGIDGTAALGLQIRIPRFGYVTAGPLLYLIDGTSRSYTGKETFFSNQNNIRGWIAIDFFPTLKEITNNIPYLSLEFSASPKIDSSRRVPVQEFSISVSIGSVTKRLYGTENDIEWEP